MLNLSNIKSASGTTKKKKRIGRGNASGHGTYSTKGQKGQRARSGVSRFKLKRLGMKPMLLNLPKNRGFKSPYAKNEVVNLVDINKFFKDGAEINRISMVKTGLIDNNNNGIKILGKGTLSVKNLIVKEIEVSATAKEQIEKLGGKVELIEKKKKDNKKKKTK